MQDKFYNLDLGFAPITIQVNKASALPTRYFSPRILQPGKAKAGIFNLCLREIASLNDLNLVLPKPNGYRGQTARKGIYRSEHVGPPIHVSWDGWDSCEITGPNLDFVVWAYYMKMMLTLFAVQQGYIHLKAACLEINGQGVLIVGLGKTTLSLILSQSSTKFCFISNTHVLVDDARVATGIHSNIRLRINSHVVNSELIEPDSTQQSDPKQIFLTPERLFGTERLKLMAPIRAIIHRLDIENEEVTVEQINGLSYQAFWHRFVYALAVYDLEEELFVDFLQRDCKMYQQIVARDFNAFDKLLATVPVYQVRGDLYKNENQLRFLTYMNRIF